MKKLILSIFILTGFAFNAQAQDISKNALGLRLGDSDGFGAEISYQRGLSEKNRLEFDLGWRNRNNAYYNNARFVKMTGLYQWVWNIEGGFNWYAGAGGGIANGSYNYKINGDRYSDNYTYAFIAGDIGIEYLFDFPLQLSLDFRPEIYFSDRVKDDYGSDIAISARYRF